MMDFLIQTGISNACFALMLAVVATIVGTGGRRPQLAHWLWLLVFIKLVTPPVFNIPVMTSVDQPSAVPLAEDAMTIPAESMALPLIETERGVAAVFQSLIADGWMLIAPWLGMIWLSGSMLIVVWSMFRVWQFNHLLRCNSTAANEQVHQIAMRISRQLDLRKLPTLLTTSARISPLVWWAGGKVIVAIPQSLIDEMEPDEWQWVLAHELAHVRRRDYLVRWLEWFAGVCFWWNPVVWWAQRNLRVCEELCCDGLVLSRMKPERHSYADSILKTVESLVCPAFRPPAMASEINSGGYLERRIVMIMSGNVLKESTRLMQICVVALALVVFPLGLVYGQDFEKVEKRLQKSVEKGHLSQEQAEAMMGTLKRMGEQGSDRPATRDTDRKTERDAAAVRAREAATVHAREVAGALAREAYAKAAVEMEKAVEAGKISKEDMAKRLIEYKKVIAERQQQAESSDRRTTREDYARAEAEMEKMVAEGKVKKEDVERRLAEVRKVLAEKNGAAEESRRTLTSKQYAEAVAKMEKMAAEGKVKREEMEMRLAEMKKMIGKSRSDATGETSEATDRAKADELRVIAEKIRAAVESGDLSPEDARKKLEEIRAGMSDRKPVDRKLIDKEKAAKEKSDADAARAHEGMILRLKMAVESGKITEEQAEARLKGFMDQKAKDREGAKRDAELKKDGAAKEKAKVGMDEITKKIHQAVADGQITKEEAEAKLKALKEATKDGDRATYTNKNPKAQNGDSDRVMSQKRKNELETNAALEAIEVRKKEHEARIKAIEARNKKTEAEAGKKKDGDRD